MYSGQTAISFLRISGCVSFHQKSSMEDDLNQIIPSDFVSLIYLDFGQEVSSHHLSFVTWRDKRRVPRLV